MPKVPNVTVHLSDPDFIKAAISKGRWERYEHPQKGQTLTLLAGNVAVLSLHEIILSGQVPAGRFMDMFRDKDQHLAFFLLAENAKLQKQMTALLELLEEMKTQYLPPAGG
jgi:hypothetical protein